MSDTTIKLSEETKQALNAEQLDGETFDDTVSRLLGNAKGRAWTEKEIYEVALRAADDKVRELRR